MTIRRLLLSSLCTAVLAAAMLAPAQAQAQDRGREAPELRRGAPDPRDGMRERMRDDRMRPRPFERHDDLGRDRRLSPEERMQLREQIREANRDWRDGRGKGRDRR